MGMVKITDTVLRDAHQSLAATRMRTGDMLPIIEKLDQVGFFSLEAWGGATFDTCIRFLNEDPWERLRLIKKAAKTTPVQMLLRGQNLVGYRHYSDDVVDKFVTLAAKNGVDIFRIFDAVNDVRNMERSIRAAKKCGSHVQGTICYTISPVHTNDTFIEMAKELAAFDCDSICRLIELRSMWPLQAGHVKTLSLGNSIASFCKGIPSAKFACIFAFVLQLGHSTSTIAASICCGDVNTDGVTYR